MLKTRVFAHKEEFFQNVGLLVASKFVIFFTKEAFELWRWYLPTSPFHYGYKKISQLFQLIVKNGSCYLHFPQRDCRLTAKNLQMRPKY